MMKSDLIGLLSVFALSLIPLTARSQVAESVEEAIATKRDLPSLEVSSLRKPLEVKLGSLQPNTSYLFQLPVKNLLGRDFKPTEVMISCKCVNVQLEDKPIQIGDTSIFRIFVKSGVRTNTPFNQEVKVFDKDEATAPIVLRLIGVVRFPLDISTREVRVEQSEHTLLRELTCTTTDPAVDLSGVVASTRFPGVEVKVVSKAKQNCQLQLRIDECEAFQLRIKQELYVSLGNINVDGKAESQDETFVISFMDRVMYSPGKLLMYDDGETATGRITLSGEFDAETNVTIASATFKPTITNRRGGEITLTITSEHVKDPPPIIELTVEPKKIITTIPVEVLSRSRK